MSLEQEQPDLPDSADATEVVDAPETDVDLENPELSQPTEEDELEDEIDGAKVRGKKEVLERLRAERLMHGDYTRKTQEVAEQRRAIETDRQAHQEAVQAHQVHLREVATLVAVDERINQFAQVNWQALNQEDPQRAQALHIEFTQLQSTRGQLVNQITQKQQQQQVVQQQDIAKRIHQGYSVLARDIKGWSPELETKLFEYGREQGIPVEVLSRSVANPELVKIIHKAYLGDQLVKQSKPKPKELPKPATRVGGSSATSQKEPSQMSDAEFARWRRSQIAQRK